MFWYKIFSYRIGYTKILFVHKLTKLQYIHISHSLDGKYRQQHWSDSNLPNLQILIFSYHILVPLQQCTYVIVDQFWTCKEIMHVYFNVAVRDHKYKMLHESDCSALLSKYWFQNFLRLDLAKLRREVLNETIHTSSMLFMISVTIVTYINANCAKIGGSIVALI